MEAPNYPPAAGFQPPVPAPYALSVDTVSLGELMSAPAAWSIVIKHAPLVQLIVNAPQAKPYLFNLTLETFTGFGLVSQSAVGQIDQELRRLPRKLWPAE